MYKWLSVVMVLYFTAFLYDMPRAASPSEKYRFNSFNLFDRDITVRVKTDLKSFHDAIDRAKTNEFIRKKMEKGTIFEGFANFNAPEKTCTIYWPYPEFEQLRSLDSNIDIYSDENKKKMAMLGHELLHCLTGNFHD